MAFESPVPGVMSTMKQALQSFYAPFRQFISNLTLASGENWFDHLPSVKAGTAMGYSNLATLDAFVKTTPGVITFVDWSHATSVNFTVANMKNKAGTIVSPSSAGIQSAISDFVDQIAANDDTLTVDIVDGSGTSTWPLSSLVYILIFEEYNTTDCRYVEQLLPFLVWTQVLIPICSCSSALGY